MIFHMKLSEYAAKVGIKYQTVWKHYRNGLIPGAYQLATGTIIVPDGVLPTLLSTSGRRIEVANEAENDREELMQDLIAIITSFTARYYGRRRAKHKTEQLIEELRSHGHPG